MKPGITELMAAVQQGDLAAVRSILHARPELINFDLAENNEHRAVHFAVLERNVAMTKLLMEAGADARKGIFPHRDATSAYVIARDRGYADILAVIEEEERLRREELSCPNATVSPVQDQISRAIVAGEIEAAIRLLDEDPTLIQACDRNGATPLHIAAEEGEVTLADWLIRRRAAVNKRDLHERTPLDCAAWAAADSFPAMAKLLLESGAEFMIVAAVALGDLERVRALLRLEPDRLRQIGRQGGLLTLAVKHDQAEVAKLLLSLGADVDERITFKELEEPVSSWGMPLWLAALNNQYAMTELLLEHGADPNANVYASGWPLRNAWPHPDGRVKTLLLERGAQMQPYMVSETHDVAQAQRLLDEDDSEKLAQELTWSACDKGCPEILEMSLARLDWPRDDKRWHWILIQPIRGATPENGHFRCMEILLRHGIDPNVSRYGQTALHFAAAYSGQVSDADRAQFAGMLLDAGASLKLRDHLLQSTPLGWACRWGRQKLAALLIDRGAAIDEPDAEAWATPRAWTEKMATHIEALPPGRVLTP